jgi:hypothetical protein
MEHAQSRKTPSYDTKMLLKVSLIKRLSEILRLVITLNKTFIKQIQNNQKSIGKSIPAMDFKNVKKKIREPKVLPTVRDL